MSRSCVGDSCFTHIKQKSLGLSVETALLFSTLHETVVSAYRPSHTQFHESLRLQFPFVFRRLQSLQLLLPARPRLSASLGFHFHGLSPLPLLFLTPAVFARFRSLQFWVLTTQPLCFLSLPPDSAPQWPPQCAALAFAPSAFSVLSRLVSHALAPGSGTQLRCSFPFALP